jgi:hypothetical protein
MKPLNYLCLVDGVVEYGSTSLSDFAHYQTEVFDIIEQELKEIQ